MWKAERISIKGSSHYARDWLVDWSLTALSTQCRSYCAFKVTTHVKSRMYQVLSALHTTHVKSRMDQVSRALHTTHVFMWTRSRALHTTHVNHVDICTCPTELIESYDDVFTPHTRLHHSIPLCVNGSLVFSVTHTQVENSFNVILKPCQTS